MKRVLHLTSPHMRGTDVKDAQWLLGHNKSKRSGRPFGNFFPDGKVDGEYGPYTASASAHAKYWLGYETKDQVPTFGQVIYDYLSGKKALPADYQSRREHRIKLAQQTPKKVKAFRLGLSQLGVKEYPPYSNNVLYSRWYGITGPWCAMFLTWCFVNVGHTSFRRGSRFSYVPNIYDAARWGQFGLSLTRSPTRGDLALYDTPHGILSHVGFFDQWLNDGAFRDLSGNTSSSNISNGGIVEQHTRYRSQVHAFVKVP